VAEFLDARFNVDNDIQDGRAFSAETSTLSLALTKLAALNSKSLCLMVDKLIDRADRKGPAVLDVPFLKATEFAAIRALRRTDGAILGDKVIARTSLDAFGGVWQNSKPYFNTPLSASLPRAGDTFTDLEARQIIDAGGYVIDANRAGTDVVTGPVTTTYKTDPAGNPDVTYKYLNYVDTATAAREYIVNNTRAQYPQYRATGGQLINGVDSANEASVATFVAELYSALGDVALVNTGTGTVGGETVDYDKLFRESLTVTLNPSTGRFIVALKLGPVRHGYRFRGVIMADQEIILTDASIEVDDETITVKGNTIVIKEGQGETTTEAATRGGRTVAIPSADITTRVGMIKFEMPASISSMNFARDVKARGAGRVVRLSGTDPQGNRLGRTLTQAIMSTDPEKAIQNEGSLPLEFAGAPLIPS